MKLTDLMPLENWVAIEKEIADTWGIDANFFDTEGVRISTHKNWANRLCPEIKATDKGQSFICAVAHMNVATLAKNSREPVIEECDGGLIKMVVPIFAGDEFVGAFGACGFLLDGGEVDTFLINKITDIEEEKVESLAEGIRSITTEDARRLADDIRCRVEKIVRQHQG
jgi:ligand-binding sensor protein